MTKKILVLGCLILCLGIVMLHAGTFSGGGYEVSEMELTQTDSPEEITGAGFSLIPRTGDIVGNVEISNADFNVETLGVVADEFIIASIAANNLSDAHVYPNPFRISRGHTDIKFTKLSAKTEIRIYSVSGELVKILNKDDSTEDQIIWDLKNENGEEIFSGIYLYYIKSDTELKCGKIMIIK